MTLIMQDSITVANLTADADAYLGYVDGHFATWPALTARFGGSGAHLLPLAVFAQDDAEGCDCENGDLTPAQVPAWVQRQLARGLQRPVVYASASVMRAVLARLRAAGIGRATVRLLSAHYGAGAHICGPATCRLVTVAMDGTQFTDQAPGANGSKIDNSILNDDFFDTPEAAMPLSSADIQAVAKATAQLVWTIDGIIPAPDGNPANTHWQPQRVLSSMAEQVNDTASDIATDVLKGLNPVAIAEAIAGALGPEIGQQVVDALQARLAAPAAT